MESKQQHIEEKEINKNEKQANDNQQLNMQHQDTGQSVRQQITGEQQHQIQQQSGPLEVQRHFQQPVLEQHHHQEIQRQFPHAEQQEWVDNHSDSRQLWNRTVKCNEKMIYWKFKLITSIRYLSNTIMKEYSTSYYMLNNS